MRKSFYKNFRWNPRRSKEDVENVQQNQRRRHTQTRRRDDGYHELNKVNQLNTQVPIVNDCIFLYLQPPNTGGTKENKVLGQVLVTWTWSLDRWLNFFPWIIRHSSAEPFCASAKRRAVSGYEYDRKVRKIHYILLFHVKNGKTAYRRQSLKRTSHEKCSDKQKMYRSFQYF